MEFFLRLIIVGVGFVLFLFLFYKAAGTLSIRQMNLYNLSFYYLLIFAMIGGSIVFLGFRDHYLIRKVSEENIDKTYMILLYSVLMLPFIFIISNKMMGIGNYKRFYRTYVNKKMDFSRRTSNSIFSILVILTGIGAIALFYVFWCIGYISLIELLKGNFSITEQRQVISRGFTGNPYVKNLLAMGMVPYISYLAYIYSRETKQLKWKILFVILFLLSILAKTYNFEKAPVIIYICYFYIIEVLMGRSMDIKKILGFAASGAAILLLFYIVVFGYKGKILSLTNGPMSRLFITQIATLFLHVQAFPSINAFLDGASFPSILGFLFSTSEHGVRSGRVVMAIFNKTAVENGTAGVMNTIYIGEAYANFGIGGAIVAPIIVGIVMSVIPNLILKQEKDPINIAIYVMISNLYATALVGGYIDFIYSAMLIVMLIVFIGIRVVVSGGKIKLRKCSSI